MKTIVMLFALLLCGAASADAQFYEVDIKVKTTVTQSGTPKMVACDMRTDQSTLYRKQGSVTIKGVIWGCDCDTLIKGEPYTSSTNAFGYFFWNVTSQKPLNVKLEWPIANRIDKSAAKCELTWILSSEDGTFYLVGSGFGSLKDNVLKDKNTCTLLSSIISPVSGSFAGWMLPGAVVTTKATSGTCNWCEKIEGTEAVTATAPGWPICLECGETCSLNQGSSAFGTWKIKYNKKISAKLQKATKITEAYTFPAYVKAVMD
ncbi:MAG: hypothetical protein MJ240_00050 [Kiritimatiellae bacterium]|nr:hypothetical protein [Kiritimatiellia bacterium]